MNKLFKSTGIIIRKINLKEADRIVTILTDDYGKIDCIAKGARRLKSKFCGRLELFSKVNLTCFQGWDLVILNEVELLQGFVDTKDINKHSILFYIAELTNKLIQSNQQIEGVYQLLEDTIEHIENSDKSNVILHSYLIKLLTLTGFLSPWDKCAKCNNKLNISNPVYLNAVDANVACGDCRISTDKVIDISLLKWINFMQNYPLSDALKVKVEKGDHKTVWRWLQSILNELFSGPIKSEEFLMC